MIRIISPRHALIPGTSTRPEVTIIREGNLWFAFYVGSGRAGNYYAGAPIPGGCPTPQAAVQWLYESLS